MTQETLLRILFENGHEDIIALAVKIDAGIQDTPEFINCRINKNELKPGTRFKGDSYHGTVQLEVKLINPYKLKEKYLVQLPNGNLAMKAEYADVLSIIEDIPSTDDITHLDD